MVRRRAPERSRSRARKCSGSHARVFRRRRKKISTLPVPPISRPGADRPVSRRQDRDRCDDSRDRSTPVVRNPSTTGLAIARLAPPTRFRRMPRRGRLRPPRDVARGDGSRRILDPGRPSVRPGHEVGGGGERWPDLRRRRSTRRHHHGDSHRNPDPPHEPRHGQSPSVGIEEHASRRLMRRSSQKQSPE